MCMCVCVCVCARLVAHTQLLLKKSQGLVVEMTLERVKKAAGRVSTKVSKSK